MQSKGHESALCADQQQNLETAPDLRGFTQPPTRLNKITEGTRTTPESIVNQAVKDRLDYEEWLLAEVDAGLADVKAGRVMSNEDFWKSIESARRGNKKAA